MAREESLMGLSYTVLLVTALVISCVNNFVRVRFYMKTLRQRRVRLIYTRSQS